MPHYLVINNGEPQLVDDEYAETELLEGRLVINHFYLDIWGNWHFELGYT